MPARYAHLHLHSEYSLVDSTIRIPELVTACAARGLPAVAITDQNNLFALVKFYKEAEKAGIKPIAGADVLLAEGTGTPSRLTLLCRDQAGYLSLSELLTRAWMEGHRVDGVVARPAWLEANAGLFALAGPQSEAGQLLAGGRHDLAEAAVADLQRRFGERLHLELVRTGRQGEDAFNAFALDVAARRGIPVVASNDVRFLDAEGFDAHEARVCIASGRVLDDARRPRDYSAEQFLKPADAMAALFADIPDALDNSLALATRCNLELRLGTYYLPAFPVPDDETLDSWIRSQSRDGLARRLERAPLAPGKAREDYETRLETELDVIVKMGFPGYFLIVADFINWAKQHGIPVGPGRGSGAGSLVAWALGITDLDPLPYDLLFERFLNPERVSMPDFDIDFCMDRRDEVIDYVARKYGRDRVSQIITYGTMAAKAVIRDVGRVLNLGFNFVDQFAKLIPNELGITLKDAREKEPAINERAGREEEIRELLELAERLEGLTRNVGMHAGGVLIAPGKLTDFCPLYSAGGAETAVSQFDKDDVEKAGLVKFDFLGLRTLTILAEAVRFVKDVEGIEVDLDRLPLDDKPTYDRIFKTANTTAVFQFESRGMKETLLQAKPDRLEDLIALNALYRPGPMDFIPNFIARKHGRERIVYPHPLLEKVVGNTYGIMVYQEQVMQAAQVVAGYSLGGADLLRRAMGKKKAEEMAKQRESFVAGAEKNGIGADKANEIFDTMEKFAGYGFNKSHAAAYSLVAYQTAYLKCHHPAAFMAATLSSEMADTDKVQFFVADAVSCGLTFLPPDINRSRHRFTPVDAKTIRYGLGAIKGTGESAIGAIQRAREGADGKAGGDFTDLFDFCRRIDKRVVNRRIIEALVRAGAFDSIDDQRARLMASVGIALEAAEQAERDALQVGLFDAGGGAEQRVQMIEVPPWSERERLLNEKQALGFFLSGHPYNEVRDELSAFVRRPLSALEPQKETVLLAGIVTATRTQMTRRGKMIVVTLDDGTGQVEMTVFNELFEAERDKIRVDDPLIVEGKVSRDDFNGGLRVVADRLMTLAEARGRYAKVLRVALNGKVSRDNAAAEKLRTLLAPYRNGPCPVRVRYRNAQAECELPLGDTWRVRLDDELLAGLQQWLEAENVEVVYL